MGVKIKPCDCTVPGQYLTTQFFEAISFIPPFASILNTNESSEMQSEPPYWGDGLSHILILVLLPSPQDSEQELQSPQIPQLPSTSAQMYVRIYR